MTGGSELKNIKTFVARLRMCQIDITKLDTSKLETFNDVFDGCTFESFSFCANDTHNIKEMVKSFQYCRATNIDLASSDLSHVRNTSALFRKACIDETLKLRLGKITSAQDMFNEAIIRNLDFTDTPIHTWSGTKGIFNNASILNINISDKYTYDSLGFIEREKMKKFFRANQSKHIGKIWVADEKLSTYLNETT